MSAKLFASVMNGGTISAISTIGTSSRPRYTIVIANPRRIRCASQFTGDESATARKIAISSQVIGLRSC